MRHLTILFSGLLLTSVLFAQKGFEVGVRGIYQSTWLVNKSDFAEGPELDFKASWGPAYGISLGYNFSDYAGVRTNVLLSTIRQNYKGDFGNLSAVDDQSYSSSLVLQRLMTANANSQYTASVDLQYIKIPLLFRANSFPYKGAFFSFVVGPQVNLLSSATHIYKGEDIDYSETPGGDFQTKELYTNTTYGVVLGLGADISLTDLLKLNLNFRFDYTIQDAENKSFEYSAANLRYWHKERADTHPGAGGLMVGLTYTFQ